MPRCTVDKHTSRDFVRFINPVADEMDAVPIRLSEADRPSWTFDGNVDRPTITPSVRHTMGDKWHYSIANGQMTIHEDSPTGAPKIVVDLPDIEEWERPGKPMWVVTKNPEDYPGKFVVRRWVMPAEHSSPLLDLSCAGFWCYVADTLEEVRRVIPRSKKNIGRMAQDDPVIVEVWC